VINIIMQVIYLWLSAVVTESKCEKNLILLREFFTFTCITVLNFSFSIQLYIQSTESEFRCWAKAFCLNTGGRVSVLPRSAVDSTWAAAYDNSTYQRNSESWRLQLRHRLAATRIQSGTVLCWQRFARVYASDTTQFVIC